MILASSVFDFTPTAADWLRILPELIVLGAALLVLLADLAVPAKGRGWLALVGLLGVVAAGAVTSAMWISGDGLTAFNGMVASDKAALFADLVILFAAALGLLFSPGYVERQGIRQHGEYYTLLLLAALGMMLMASAASLLIVFAGLEVLSLALYILSAFIVTRPRSQEAGMKYFILSSFASAFLLYGMALTYGATGATALTGIHDFVAKHAAPAGDFRPLLLAGLGLMAVGFCFKVSAVPFQAWTPDVYVGAPTSITAFMSVGTKVAAFAALARVFMVALGPVAAAWSPVLWAVAVLTMIGGNLYAVTQRDVKRMLAYSSVANAGYMLVAVVTGTQQALAALLIYLAAYAAMNLGAFGVVLALERNDGLGTGLEEFNGLARRRRGLAAVLAVCLLALAGIPPTVGFAGKFAVFYAAIAGGRLELAIIGVLTSVLGMFYYLRVIWAMYFVEPQPARPAPAFVVAPAAAPPASAFAAAVPTTGGVAVAEPQVAATTAVRADPVAVSVAETPHVVYPGAWLALAAALIATIALGILPGALIDLATQAAQSLLR